MGASNDTVMRASLYPETKHCIIANMVHEPPWYGTVRPVVWEVGGSDPVSYPIHKLIKMEDETKLVSDEFREMFDDELADEIEEYLFSYPFPVKDLLSLE